VVKLIRDGMRFFDEYIMNEDIDDRVKTRLIELFSKSFNLLTMFVLKNATN
jgi:hypothetical protein